MHNENIETADEREDDRRTAVNAADDTGLVSQQEFLNEAELGDDAGSLTEAERE